MQTMIGRAMRLFDAGPLDEAIAAYRQLLDVYPDLPNSWYNLSLLERRARLFDDALASTRQAIDRGIEGPEEVYLQRGVIHADDRGDAAAARAELAAALALSPGYIPAWLNLGNLEEDIGDRPAAEHAYRRVLVIMPGQPLALARLAGVVRPQATDDPLLVQIRARLAQPGTSLEERADLGFALGGALDRLGAYDEAFAAFATANGAARLVSANAGLRYDRVAHERLIDRLILAFDTPTRRSQVDDAPIFICGMFRSGSTLAERILSRHSRLSAGGELTTVPMLAASCFGTYPEDAATADGAQLDSVRDRYLADTAPRRVPGRRLIDKRPDNVLHLGLIKRLFPDARIVHTRRAVMDNCLSVYALHADPAFAYATDLGDILHYRVQEQRLMDHWKALYGADIFELDYDRLVAHPRETVESLASFCGLGWEDDLLAFGTGGGAVRTASVWQVREPLYGHASGRWRNYASHLGALRKAAEAAGFDVGEGA